jgi:hypothetical protein
MIRAYLAFSSHTKHVRGCNVAVTIHLPIASNTMSTRDLAAQTREVILDEFAPGQSDL